MAYIDKDKIPYYLDTSEEAPMEGRKITFKSDIDKIPTADVVEVKHGQWLDNIENISTVAGVTKDLAVGYKCSVCGRTELRKEPYCNCGAMMK